LIMRMTRPEQLCPSLDFRESRQFASEIKFLVPCELGDEIRAWARQFLAADPFAGGEMGDTYRTTSLYFDTAAFDVLAKTGSFGRSKYRIRRYGESDGVFLERKMKSRDLVSKRRSIVSIADLAHLRHRQPQRGWAGHWFHRRIEARLLQPVCQISYLRTARIGTGSNGPIRLTLDQNVRALAVGRAAFDVEPGKPIADGQMILELKFRHSVPAQFAQLIEKFRLEPQPVSKYRLASTVDGCVHGWVMRVQPSAA
jgi:hypothetical protein